MTGGQDRRRAARVRFVCPVTYSVTSGRRESLRSSGTTLDLSAGGVRFDAPTRLLVGDVLDLEITSGEIRLLARGRVVHVMASVAGRGLEVGVEFVRLDPAAEAALRSLAAHEPPSA